MTAALAPAPRPLLWVGYTTRYRSGSDKFARAADTLANTLRRAHPDAPVLLEALVSKADFVRAMARIERSGAQIGELHFIGHSGMYGVMFGSTTWPEQFSPHEWRSLRIPFARGASAHFHACRSARWFAPFFARTFHVRAYGHQGYTTVSARADRFEFEGFFEKPSAPLYLVSVPGRKTHGLAGAVRKYAQRPPAEPMLACDPEPAPDASYDAVAELYDRAFSDIRVRRAEWRWFSRHFAAAFPPQRGRPRVLDLGCGNGALLHALAPLISRGEGVDASRAMLARAEQRARSRANLRFRAIDGPSLPFPDASFDLVTSFLSFRYLDWDPILAEIRRVLSPRGRLLVVDMVEQPLSARDAGLFVRSSLAHLVRGLRDRGFVRRVGELSAHPGWQAMLRHNPVRAAHEYRFYFESRFPGRRLETLSVGRRARLVAFDSGPLERARLYPLSYP